MKRSSLLILLALSASALLVAVLSLHDSKTVQLPSQADLLVVDKGSHTLTLLRQGKVLKTYAVALGRGGTGPKLEAGDNRVPEGQYKIVGRNAHSIFHKALRIGYPTPEQTRQARLQGHDPGGDIMIHGLRNGLGWIGHLQTHMDWTKGCIAVTNAEIEEIWQSVPDGATIQIHP